MNNNYVTITSDKNKKTALILCCIGFLGICGLHDFYLGKIGKGIIKLITVNWLFIGQIIDIIKILSGTYTDGSNAPLRK